MGCRARGLIARPWLRAVRRYASASFALRSHSDNDDAAAAVEAPPPQPTPTTPSCSLFPKGGQTLELVCESLAFKGKGVCKVVDTGFVLMWDRALPGEHFIGRFSRKKGSYAEVQKLKAITPHHEAVVAPCEYAGQCGGCKMQSLLYQARVRAQEQDVRDLILLVGRFSEADSDFSPDLKPIVPCEMQDRWVESSRPTDRIAFFSS